MLGFVLFLIVCILSIQFIVLYELSVLSKILKDTATHQDLIELGGDVNLCIDDRFNQHLIDMNSKFDSLSQSKKKEKEERWDTLKQVFSHPKTTFKGMQ
jgi:hypothetical protein